MAICATVAQLSPAHYTAEAKVLVPPPQGARSSVAPKDANASPAAGQDWLTREVEILTSSEVIQQTKQRLPAESLFTGNAEFLTHLSVRPESETGIIKLSFQSRDAAAAADALNQLIAAYRDQKQTLTLEGTVQAQQAIAQQLLPARRKVQVAEQALRQFQQAHQISSQTSTPSQDLRAAQASVANLQRQLQTVEVNRQAIAQELGFSPTETQLFTQAAQSNTFKRQLKKLTQLKLRLGKAESQYTEQHPAVADLARQATDVQQQLQQTLPQSLLEKLVNDPTRQELTDDLVEAETQHQALVVQLNQVTTQIGNLQPQVEVQPEIEQKNRDLEREAEQAQTYYNSLVRRQQELNIALQQKPVNAQVLSPAVPPPHPERPWRMPLFGLGAFLGLGFGTIAMGISEYKDRSLSTAKEVETYLGLKVLGRIPRFEPTVQAHLQLYDGDLQRFVPPIFALDKPGSQVSESFRMLYLNLKVHPIGKTLGTLTITSAVAQEGKSTIVANLGAVMAQTGRRVLIVDANPHQPFQDLLWNLPNEVGLSNVLMAQTSLLLAVQPVLTNLDVLTSGSVKHLAEFPFESKEMSLLVANLGSRYDTVLFDVPALNATADAAIMGQLTHGVLLVARPGKVDEFTANRAKETLSQGSVAVLGMVINESTDPEDGFMPLEEEDWELEELEEEMALVSPRDRFREQQLLEGSALQGRFGTLQNPEALTPLELERQLEGLQRNWDLSNQLLANKEEELMHLCQVVQDIQIRLNQQELTPLATVAAEPEEERQVLECQLQQGVERKEFLLAQVAELRRTLEQEQRTFHHYLNVLRSSTAKQ